MKWLRTLLFGAAVEIGSRVVDWQVQRKREELEREQGELSRLVERELGIPEGSVNVWLRTFPDGTTMPQVEINVPLSFAQQGKARKVLNSIGKKVRTDFPPPHISAGDLN